MGKTSDESTVYIPLSKQLRAGMVGMAAKEHPLGFASKMMCGAGVKGMEKPGQIGQIIKMENGECIAVRQNAEFTITADQSSTTNPLFYNHAPGIFLVTALDVAFWNPTLARWNTRTTVDAHEGGVYVSLHTDPYIPTPLYANIELPGFTESGFATEAEARAYAAGRVATITLRDRGYYPWSYNNYDAEKSGSGTYCFQRIA